MEKLKQKIKGKISRYIANKCSLAARIDQFAILPTKKFGERMKEQVEDRLKFLEKGEKTPKNIDVMKEVLDELREAGLYVESVDKINKKKSKKSKKAKVVEESEEEEEEKPKSKKKKASKPVDSDIEEEENVKPKKKVKTA